jgi:hypothetical protein
VKNTRKGRNAYANGGAAFRAEARWLCKDRSSFGILRALSPVERSIFRNEAVVGSAMSAELAQGISYVKSKI